MVVNEKPLSVTFGERKSVARRKHFLLTVLLVGERVIARIDRGIAIDANVGVLKFHGQLGKLFISVDKIVLDGIRRGAKFVGNCPPQHAVLRIERGDRAWIFGGAFREIVLPRIHRGDHILLISGLNRRGDKAQQNDKCYK